MYSTSVVRGLENVVYLSSKGATECILPQQKGAGKCILP